MSYPVVSDNNFNDKFTKKFRSYKIPDKKKPFRQICFPSVYELQPQQKLLAQVINPNSPYKGILVFHNIGSGKTCTAITMCEQWKGKKRIVWVCPASLIGNTRDELRSPCTGTTYVSKKERKLLKQLDPSDKEYLRIIRESDKKIDKYYNIYSYNKFVKLIKTNKLRLRNTLLVVDEVQNMISDGGIYYQYLHQAITESTGTHTVLLSATPIYDSITEIPLLLNLLPISKKFPTAGKFIREYTYTKEHRTYTEHRAQNLDKFKKNIQGFISYFPGAPSYTYPEKKIHYVRSYMEPFQYKAYQAAQRKERKKHKGKLVIDGQLGKLSSSFFLGTRLMSNICFPNKKINQDAIDSLDGIKIENLQKYSIKFYKVFKKIKQAERSVLVYSNFIRFGIESFAKVLEENGYINFQDGQKKNKTFAIFSGNESREYKNKIRNTFNNINNKYGESIKIMLLSPSAAEGVSFLNISQLHILEPYWNMSKIYQIMGRGVRFCSHKNLTKDNRVVDIYIYKAVHDNEKISIDEYILKIADKKDGLIKEFERAMIEASIDCELNKNLFDDKTIECGV